MKAYIGAIVAILFPIASIAKDTDGDGLADDLESQIGTSISLSDSDGDGGSDYEELRVECDPTNPKHKIVKFGEWENYISRNVTISYDGKIVEKIDRRRSTYLIEKGQYFYSLKSRKNSKEWGRNATAESKALMAEKEKYLATSPRYEEIKKMRVENDKLRKKYISDSSNENLEAWNKVRIPMVQIENQEYEAAKLRVATLPYRPKGKVEELEERIEELEDEVDSLKDE